MRLPVSFRKIVCIVLFLVILAITLVYNNFNNENSEGKSGTETRNSIVKILVDLAPSVIPEPKPSLAWILHFNYEPHPEALKTLLHHYSKHFELIVVVSHTGQVGQLLDFDTSSAEAEVIWSEPCPNILHGAAAGLMMRCYAKGLEILKSNSKFPKVDYVVLSNDDVILNMTKVKEFALEGVPVSHSSPSDTAPPMFEIPPKNGTYWKGWGYRSWWPECQEAFSKVPPEFKSRYRKRFGQKAFNGGVDIFFLPTASVSEFIFLSSIVSECWIEISIPNSLAMLSEPIKFYSPPSEVFMYRWWGVVITPLIFEQQLAQNSIVSFHPFKLSYPEHRVAFAQFMTKYKLN